MRLPVEALEATVLLADVSKPATTVGAGRHVLVVDDDADVRRTVGRSLQVMGYRVDVLASRELASERLERTAFHAAVVDVQMPGPRLPAFLRELGTRCPRLPILLMSGDPSSELTPELRAQSPAPMGFIAKPFNPAQLTAAVHALTEA
ncbi:MAG: response regulator [Myxococcales bacterium]|nr:response regulator [Myxococcales bacterium]